MCPLALGRGKEGIDQPISFMVQLSDHGFAGLSPTLSGEFRRGGRIPVWRLRGQVQQALAQPEYRLFEEHARQSFLEPIK